VVVFVAPWRLTSDATALCAPAASRATGLLRYCVCDTGLLRYCVCATGDSSGTAFVIQDSSGTAFVLQGSVCYRAPHAVCATGLLMQFVLQGSAE